MSYRINQWADFFEAILIKFPKWLFSQLRKLWRRWRLRGKPTQPHNHEATFKRWTKQMDRMTAEDWRRLRNEVERDRD